MRAIKDTTVQPPMLGDLRAAIVEDAIAAIEQHPASVNMMTWLLHDETVPATVGEFPNYCGTIACLAGHIGIALGLPPKESFTRAELLQSSRVRRLNLHTAVSDAAWDGLHVSDLAARVLKLGDNYQRVFSLFAWPYRFKRDYTRAKTDKGRASTMVRRLRYYLETGN